MPDIKERERITDDDLTQRARRSSDMLLLPEERRLAATRPSLLDNPDLAGNPVAVAHARAARQNRPAASGTGSPIATALVFLVVAPALIFLVSNPLGWLALFGLCLGFGFLFGFGGIL